MNHSLELLGVAFFAMIYKLIWISVVMFLPLVAAAGIATFKGLKIRNIRELHMTFGYMMYVLTKTNIYLGGYFHGYGKWQVPIYMWTTFVLVVHYIIRQATKPPKAERVKVQ
jgi:uncharacterized membrane protein